jgi:hypothetical protein
MLELGVACPMQLSKAYIQTCVLSDQNIEVWELPSISKRSYGESGSSENADLDLDVLPLKYRPRMSCLKRLPYKACSMLLPIFVCPRSPLFNSPQYAQTDEMDGSIHLLTTFRWPISRVLHKVSSGSPICCQLVFSVESRSWLIPAFHIELGLGRRSADET